MIHSGDPFIKSNLREFGETIFAEMSALAIETGAINLGQGFPDTDGPIEISELAIQAIRNGQNQYPPGLGIPELRKAISAHQKRFYNLDFDFDTEVLVTAGATEGIAASLLALCKPGDEVITFEPYYDSYAASIALSGATRRVVTLRTPNYQFDPEELRNSVNANTKAILVNSPHNPTGKVFKSSPLIRIDANINSVHEITKQKIAILAMPGAANGSIIENRILNLEAPSIYAASSISLGIILKKAFNIHTANGEANVTFIIISAK